MLRGFSGGVGGMFGDLQMGSVKFIRSLYFEIFVPGHIFHNVYILDIAE